MLAGLLRPALAAALAARLLPRQSERPRRSATAARPRRERRAVRRHLQYATSSPRTLRAARARARGGGLSVHVAASDGDARRSAAAARFSRRAWSTRRSAKRAHARGARAASSRAACRSSGSSLRACSALRDEFRTLLPGEAAPALAAAALTFEEFLAREHAAGRAEARAELGRARARAACTATATRRRSARCAPCVAVLKLVPGLAVETIESSCCGMAGASATRRSIYDVSMQMAELALLPAVRAAPADTVDRRRRHELPAPDPRRRRARSACTSRACSRTAYPRRVELGRARFSEPPRACGSCRRLARRRLRGYVRGSRAALVARAAS